MAITVVIVLKVMSGSDERVMGIVVDAVSDDTRYPKAICAVSDLGSSIETNFIEGLVNVDEKMVVLLNIDKLLMTEELQVWLI